MKSHLCITGAVLVAAGLASAQSAHACSSFSITNATGSPPVVSGTRVNVFAWGQAPSSFINIDGVNYTYYDVYDPSLTPFPIQGSFLVPTYGTHFIWSSVESSCVLEFTTVAPEPPPAKYDTPTLSDANSGFACPYAALSWTSSTGSSTYEIWRRQLKPTIEPNMNQVWSGTTNFKSILQYAGESYTYAVRACGPDKSCSDLSNFRTVKYGVCP